jgi:hypothetical protein
VIVQVSAVAESIAEDCETDLVSAVAEKIAED